MSICFWLVRVASFFWFLVIRCSIGFSGAVRMGVSGPSVFVISFRFWVSVLFIVPMSGAVIRYEVR